MNPERDSVKKLRSDSRWWRFTEPEQARIREIYLRDGVHAAVAYCRNIGKSWSASAMCKFFRKDPAAGVRLGDYRLNKLRPDSRWWQFTEPQRKKLREIYERSGKQAAVDYCTKIGKPWSGSAMGRFFRNDPAGVFLRGTNPLHKLRSDSRWHRFTYPERARVREIYERYGVEAAVAYCRKIGKSWSGSSMCRFFREGLPGGFLPGTHRLNKLRSDSRWWQFTEREQAKIREIYYGEGVRAAAEYCRKIGKNWPRPKLADFFRKQRA